MATESMAHVAITGEPTEGDYAVSLSMDVAALRRENATLRARLREKEAECSRWALRWARDGAVLAGSPSGKETP
jgi:hypothetical protein